MLIYDESRTIFLSSLRKYAWPLDFCGRVISNLSQEVSPGFVGCPFVKVVYDDIYPWAFSNFGAAYHFVGFHFRCTYLSRSYGLGSGRFDVKSSDPGQSTGWKVPGSCFPVFSTTPIRLAYAPVSHLVESFLPYLPLRAGSRIRIHSPGLPRAAAGSERGDGKFFSG